MNIVIELIKSDLKNLEEKAVSYKDKLFYSAIIKMIDEKVDAFSWEKGDKVRNISTFNTVVFTKYSADGKYFYHEENNKPLKTELYRKC